MALWGIAKDGTRQPLRDFADAMDRAARTGEAPDNPEGVLVIQMSDTLARELAAALRRVEAFLESEGYPPDSWMNP